MTLQYPAQALDIQMGHTAKRTSNLVYVATTTWYATTNRNVSGTLSTGFVVGARILFSKIDRLSTLASA